MEPGLSNYFGEVIMLLGKTSLFQPINISVHLQYAIKLLIDQPINKSIKQTKIDKSMSKHDIL